MKVVELYYTIGDLCVLLRFGPTAIRQKIKAGEFSPPGADGKPDLGNILNVGGKDIRVPASGVNFWMDKHRMGAVSPVKARNRGELVRKIRQGQTSGLEESHG